MGWYKQHSSFAENPFDKPVRGDRTLRNNFFIMLKKKYAAPKNIAKLIT